MAYAGNKFELVASVGVANETDTVLGAVTDGLLNLGGGATTYVDVVSQYSLNENIGFSARATFARTESDATGAMVLGMSDIESNAFAFGANIGGFDFAISCPLSVVGGTMQYAYADYDVVEIADGMYDIAVRDAHVAELSMRPDVRETRLSGTYRYKFGEFTDGAFGFIYRINPNNTDAFGNESVFMMKLSHKLGI